MEPKWEELREQLMGLTTKELRTIGRRWFNGALGGASRKAEIVGEMVSTMRYWWRSCADRGGQGRVCNVLHDIQEVWNGNH